MAVPTDFVNLTDLPESEYLDELAIAVESSDPARPTKHMPLSKITKKMRTDSASQLGGVYEKDYASGDAIPNGAMTNKLMYWHNGQFYSVGTDTGFTSNDFDADLAAGRFISTAIINGYINTNKLKESNAKLGEIVTTDCYSTLFDGGGATYEITNVAEQSTRTIALNSGLFACLRESRDDFRVERAGCVDGSSVDITECLLDALKSYAEDRRGCVIHIGSGNRQMHTPFVLDFTTVARENVIIRGAGKFNTIVKNMIGPNTKMFSTNISGQAPSPVDGFEAHDFQVENPLQNSWGCCGFYIVHDARLRMSNLATRNFSNYGNPNGTNRLFTGKWEFGKPVNCGIYTAFTVGAVIDKCQDTGSGCGLCVKPHVSYKTTTTYVNYYYSQQAGVGQCLMSGRGIVLTGCINENCFSAGMTSDDGGVAFYNYECPDLVLRDCWSEVTNYYLQSSRNAFTYFDGGEFVDPRPYSKCFHIDNKGDWDYYQFVNTRINFDANTPAITLRAQYINTKLNAYAKNLLTIASIKPSYHADGDDYVMRQNLLLTRNNINATCKKMGFRNLDTGLTYGFSMPPGDNKITCDLDLVLDDDRTLIQEFLGARYRLGRNANGDAVWIEMNF